MRRQEVSCPARIGMGISSRPHAHTSPAGPPSSPLPCATAASMSECKLDRGDAANSAVVGHGVYLSNSMPAGLGSPDMQEYPGRHADRKSACGLCSPGRQQRGKDGPLTHAVE